MVDCPFGGVYVAVAECTLGVNVPPPTEADHVTLVAAAPKVPAKFIGRSEQVEIDGPALTVAWGYTVTVTVSWSVHPAAFVTIRIYCCKRVVPPL